MQQPPRPAGYQIIQIDEELKPVDDTESSLRAVYFASTLTIACLDFIQSIIASCRNGQYGEELAKAALNVIPDKAFQSAVKEITCVSVHLTMLDQGGETAFDWLKQFIWLTIEASDQMLKEPSAASIIKMHESANGFDSTCYQASVNAIDQLNFSANKQSLLDPVRIFLLSNRQYRAQLLQYALSQPIDILETHIQSMY